MRFYKDDMGILMVCAIRYCQGLQTLVPNRVQKIVIGRLKLVSDKTLEILLNDCKIQERENNYSDLDLKESWLKFRKEIQKEYDRRMRNGNNKNLKDNISK